MSYYRTITDLLKKYHSGVYTTVELYPLLVRNTPESKVLDLLRILPAEILLPFKDWLIAYPLEGGIQIRDRPEPLPLSLIRKLREAVMVEE
jgi:hypothetical protein